jgi:hypothetical protein
MRPPGYEPGELPTAPPRDINQLKIKSFEMFVIPHPCFVSAKVLLIFDTTKYFYDFFQNKSNSYILCWLSKINILHLHMFNMMCN